MRRILCLMMSACLLAPCPAFAGVPMDSMNSANAGLNPAVAVDRDGKKAASNHGPTQALVEMAQKKRKSVIEPAANSEPAENITKNK